jgi:hypothetical protein
MSTWTERRTANAVPAAILEALTDPSACERWAPVGFEIRELDGRRLRAGSRARIAGRLAGREVGFDVEVLAADEERLALQADGPFSLDVEYLMRPVPAGSEVHASVAVRPTRSGLGARLLAQATSSLLAAGALRTAVARLTREAEAIAL